MSRVLTLCGVALVVSWKGLKEEFSFIRGSLLILVITWVLMQFGGAMLFPYWSPFLRELGASPFLIGLILSISNIALFISRIPGSYLADFYGRKRLITTFTFAVGFVQLIYVFALDWRFILIGSILESLFLIYQPALWAMVADLIPEDRRGVGFAVVNVLPSIIAVFSPAIGAYIVSTYGLNIGMRYIFLILFIMYIISAFLRYFFLVETLEEAREQVDINLKGVFVDSIRAMYEMWVEAPRNLKIVILILMLSAIEDPIFLNYASLYVFDVVGLSEYEWGVLISMYMGLMIVMAYPSGKIVDRYGRRFSLMMGYTLIIPGILLILAPEIPFSIWIGMAILSFPSSLFNPAFNAIITDLTPKKFRGRVFGMIGNLNLISVVASSPLAGYLYELDPKFPFMLILFLNLFILVLVVKFIKETNHST